MEKLSDDERETICSALCKRDALQAVYDFMKVDCDNGDSLLWTPEYESLYQTVIDALDIED